MDITIEYSALSRLENFLAYLKERAKDKIHKDNGDIIADFVDKVMIVELKRLQNEPEVVKEEIELPDEVLATPLKAMKKKFDKVFKDFVEGNGIEVGEDEEEGDEETDPATGPGTSVPVSVNTTTDKAPRNGNGHKSEKKRSLKDSERDIIRSEFMNLNGQIEEDACLKIKEKLDPEVAIFQVTGFVSYLHLEIARGKFEVADMDNYLTFLQNHRDKWATYNSDKYKKMRAANTATVNQSIQPTSSSPKFANFPKKRRS